MRQAWNKGKKMTEEEKAKMNLSGLEKGRGLYRGTKGIVKANNGSFKPGHKPWNINTKRPEMTGNRHPNWKSDKVGYNAIHSWIYRTLGKVDRCDNKCNNINIKRYEWANISGEYKRDVIDWKRLCSKCHANEHKNWEVRWPVS